MLKRETQTQTHMQTQTQTGTVMARDQTIAFKLLIICIKELHDITTKAFSLAHPLVGQGLIMAKRMRSMYQGRHTYKRYTHTYIGLQ